MDNSRFDEAMKVAKCLRDDLFKKYEQSLGNYIMVANVSAPFIDASDVLLVYYVLIDYFSDKTVKDAEIINIHIADEFHICSALVTQNTLLTNDSTPPDPMSVCATLFHALMKLRKEGANDQYKRFRFSSDYCYSNMRIALVTLLYQLDRYGFCPSAAPEEFEALTLAVSDGNLPERYPEEWKEGEANEDPIVTDPVVRTVSLLLRKMVKKKDDTYHVNITEREFRLALNRTSGCICTSYKGEIDIHRRTSRSDWNHTFPGHGETRTIALEPLREALSYIWLDERDPEYFPLITGATPLYMLIEQFDEVLRRIED